MSDYKKEGIKQVAKTLLKAGFRVFIAENKEYGFYTDKEGTRIIGFQYNYCDIVFSGNYKSTNSGTGWRLDDQDASYDEMFAANAPDWAIGRDPKWSYRTLEEHQEQYQSSSKYTELIDTMKTKDQWDASKKNLSEFLNVGDEVDEMMADYFLGVLPPACMSATCIQIGEPYSHDDNDRPMFSTLTKASKDSNWVYAGVMVTPKGEKNWYI